MNRMKKYIIQLIALFALASLPSFSQVADKFLIKAGMLSEAKSYEEAFAAINQSTSKSNKYYSKLMADIQYGLKNYQQAIEQYKAIEANSPGTVQLELAKSYANLGNMSQSMEYLKSYFTQKNKLPISKINNDEAFSKFRNNAEWSKMWQSVDYSEAELKVNQVSSASESGYNEYFSDILDEALRKYPNNPELLYQQSKYFADKKMFDAAQRAIAQAINHKAGADKYYFQQAQVQLSNNNQKEALNTINDAINRNPFNLKYYLTRIDINRTLGNSEEVSKDVQLIEFYMPNNSEVEMAKIKLEADKGNYLTAIDGLSTLIEKDQSNKEYFILRGKLELKTQKLQDADEDFGMALDLNPSDADANLGKGIARHQLDDKESACYYWQKASNEGSREALNYINKYCGK